MAGKKTYDFSGVDALESPQYDFSGVDAIEQPTSTETPSATLEDYGTMLAKGAGTPFRDEVIGALTATGSKLGLPESNTARLLMNLVPDFISGGDVPTLSEKDKTTLASFPESTKSWYDEYRATQQAVDKDQREAADRTGWLGAATEMAGSVPLTVATGAISKGLPLINRYITANPLKSAALFGTGLGVGESQNTLEDPGSLALDAVISGAASAGLTKAGQKLFGKNVSTPKDILQKGEFHRKLEAAKKLGQEGLSGASDLESRAALEARQAAGESGIIKQYLEPREKLGQEIQSSVQKYSDVGDVLIQQLDELDAIKNLENVLINNSRGLGKDKASKLIEKARNMQQGLLDPAEAYTFRKELNEVYNKIADPEQKQIFQTGLDKIKSVLENSVPGFKGRLEDFAEFAKAGPESLLAKGFDPDISDIFYGDLPKGDLKVAEKIRDLLKNISQEGGFNKQREFLTAMKALEDLAEKNPDLVKKIGLDPQQFKRQFLQQADEVAAAESLMRGGPIKALYERGLFGARKATEEGMIQAANWYGRQQGKLSKNKFVQASREQLQNAANVLRQNGGERLQLLADELMSDMPQKRNAAIFSILQLPQAKELLGIGDEE